jgi:Na+/H+ antiporter NhaD/arsenite permease-like protein
MIRGGPAGAGLNRGTPKLSQKALENCLNMCRTAAAALPLTLTSTCAFAGASHISGIGLSLSWVLPFVGLLLSIALFPLLASHFWERHFGKIAAFWSLMLVLPAVAMFGLTAVTGQLLHTFWTEYMPFIVLLFSLFVVAGGIRITGNFVGTPGTNTAFLALGVFLSSLIGTTGASILLIRLMIRANQDRHRNTHVFVFFIFLVSNIGGSLTPLGDPPLFLGFLAGVDFLWTLKHLLMPMLLLSSMLLTLFYIIDRRAWAHEAAEVRTRSRVPRQVKIEGLQNFIYLGGIVGAVLLSGTWQSGVEIPVSPGTTLPLQGLARDVVLLFLSFLSWKHTRPEIRIESSFSWAPIQEVAFLFAGIFVTMIPALAILRAGPDGTFAPLVSLVTRPDGLPSNAAYFWVTGILSSFLDNAPTYLVFFHLAGGDAEALTGPLAGTLLAISAGAVFMGANSYIGNAPNFMVKAICEERGIEMPSFFGYMLWSCGILLPLFAFLTVIFFL